MSNSIPVDTDKIFEWKDEQEEILKSWAENAICYKIMHDQSYKKYWALNMWFNIPIIIISTVAGSGNFSIPNITDKYKEYAIYSIGILNILSAILATVSSYIGCAQSLESHRMAANSWGKFSRRIQMELAKERCDRPNAKDFIKYTIDEYDRLYELAPSITNDIIRWFVYYYCYNNNPLENGVFFQCINEMFCFPFGCSIYKNSNKREKLESVKNINLPEINCQISSINIFGKQNNKNNVEYLKKYNLKNRVSFHLGQPSSSNEPPVIRHITTEPPDTPDTSPSNEFITVNKSITTAHTV